MNDYTLKEGYQVFYKETGMLECPRVFNSLTQCITYVNKNKYSDNLCIQGVMYIQSNKTNNE